jgi:hypothetical protein
VRRFRAFVDVFTINPPSVTPTAISVLAVTDPRLPRLVVRRATRGAPRYHCIGFLKNYLLCLLPRPRGGTLPARVAVRSFCTQEPALKEYDPWAQAPVS